jgi:hypothetical protein
MDKLDHTVRIGLYLSSTDTFWDLVDEAAAQTAEVMQEDLLPLVFEATQPSIEEQVVLIEEVVAQELNALVIGDLHPSVLSDVADKGIPVVSPFESDLVHFDFSPETELFRLEITRPDCIMSVIGAPSAGQLCTIETVISALTSKHFPSQKV